jgi:GxxExxY protein
MEWTKGMKSLVVDSTGNDLTYRIIGAAMQVHNQLGMGYKEEVYEKALEVELNLQGIGVVRQYPMPVEYGEQQIAVFYLDFMVEEQVVVEVKAFSHLLTNDERAQVINYLKATGAPVGLVLNFGRRKLEYRRIFPGKVDSGPVQRTGRDDVFRSQRED